MQKPDIIDAVSPVIDAFEKCAIPYYIGGSIASSLYGIARATIDVDLAADIKVEHITPLKNLLKVGYYFDEEIVSEAVSQKSSFNLIHLETMIKIDVFIVKDERYQNEVFKRVRKDILEEGEGGKEFYFSSPEDISSTSSNGMKWGVEYLKGSGLIL